jgi:hypothetical protein
METIWFLVDYDLKATAENYAERKLSIEFANC